MRLPDAALSIPLVKNDRGTYFQNCVRTITPPLFWHVRPLTTPNHHGVRLPSTKTHPPPALAPWPTLPWCWNSGQRPPAYFEYRKTSTVRLTSEQSELVCQGELLASLQSLVGQSSQNINSGSKCISSPFISVLPVRWPVYFSTGAWRASPPLLHTAGS